MKATRYLFTFLVLAMLALTACHNDDLPGGNTLPEGAVHITADIEGVQTRAPQLDADGAGVTRNFAASLFRNIKYFTLRKLYLCRKWMQKRLQKTTTTGITLPNFDFLA